MGIIKGNQISSLEAFLCEGSFGSGKYYGYNNKKIISLVKVRTKNKTIGYGESLVGIYSPELFQINIKYLSKFFVKKNALEGLKEIKFLQKNKFFFINGIIKSLLAAIEIALIDLYSRENNLSITDALKKLYKLNSDFSPVKLYSSAGSIKSSLKDLEHDTKKSKKFNINRIKIRIDCQEKYIPKLNLISDNINEFAVDIISNSYPKNSDPKYVESFLDNTNNFDFLWVEEPLEVEKLIYFHKLRKQFKDIKFSYGENFNSSYDFINLISSLKFNYINPDISHITIQDFLNIISFFQKKPKKNNKIILHCWGGVINLNMSLSLASLLTDQIKYVEFPIADFSLNEKFINSCKITDSKLIIDNNIVGNPNYFVKENKIIKIKKKSVFHFD